MQKQHEVNEYEVAWNRLRAELSAQLPKLKGDPKLTAVLEILFMMDALQPDE